MLISINTRWFSQEQADSFFSFAWKKYLLQSDKGKSQSNKMQQQQQQGKTNWSHFPRSGNLKNDDQEWPQWDWGDVWFSGCFWKYDTYWWQAYFFAFKNLFHCESQPLMHEKCCPVLILHAERAEEWQLLMVQQAWSPPEHKLLCMSKKPGKWIQRKCRACSHYKRLRYSFLFCLMDAVKSRLWSRKGNLFLVV